MYLQPLLDKVRAQRLSALGYLYWGCLLYTSFRIKLLKKRQKCLAVCLDHPQSTLVSRRNKRSLMCGSKRPLINLSFCPREIPTLLSRGPVHHRHRTMTPRSKRLRKLSSDLTDVIYKNQSSFTCIYYNDKKSGN